MAAEAQHRDGTLVMSGVLDREAVVALWPRLAATGLSLHTLDLQQVSAVDSAGLALLAELAGPGVTLLGQPEGLDELRTAYRLDPHLGFASLSPDRV